MCPGPFPSLTSMKPRLERERTSYLPDYYIISILISPFSTLMYLHPNKGSFHNSHLRLDLLHMHSSPCFTSNQAKSLACPALFGACGACGAWCICGLHLVIVLWVSIVCRMYCVMSFKCAPMYRNLMRMLCAEWRLLASRELSNGIIHQFGYSVSENWREGR